jgi:hypothetical protein
VRTITFGAAAAAIVMLGATVPVRVAAAAPGMRAQSAPSIRLPRGYAVAEDDVPWPGVRHLRLVSSKPSRVVNVAIVSHAGPASLRVVISNDRIAGGTETVGAMCARIGCVVGVNGDFFSRGSAQPAGGIASAGTLLRSPPSSRWHLVQDPSGSSRVEHVATTIRFFAHAGDQTIPFYVSGVNVARPANHAVLYSDVWDSTTHTGPGFEIVLRPQTSADRVAFGTTAHVTMIAGFAGGDGGILPGDVVLSADGAYASLLENLWRRVTAGDVSPGAEIATSATPAASTFVSGAPPLLLHGRQGFHDNLSSFYQQHVARTIVGRTLAGDTILATVDAAGSSTGMTILEAMRFARSLGAYEALNLDGGSSATFVEQGMLESRSPDGREHGVAEALVVVR